MPIWIVWKSVMWLVTFRLDHLLWQNICKELGFNRMQLFEDKGILQSCSKVKFHHYCLHHKLNHEKKYNWLFTSPHVAVKNSNCTDWLVPFSCSGACIVRFYENMLLIFQVWASHGFDVRGVILFSLVEISGVLDEHKLPQFSEVWKIADRAWTLHVGCFPV
jgi:hypothetical protein